MRICPSIICCRVSSARMPRIGIYLDIEPSTACARIRFRVECGLPGTDLLAVDGTCFASVNGLCDLCVCACVCPSFMGDGLWKFLGRDAARSKAPRICCATAACTHTLCTRAEKKTDMYKCIRTLALMDLYAHTMHLYTHLPTDSLTHSHTHTLTHARPSDECWSRSDSKTLPR